MPLGYAIAVVMKKVSRLVATGGFAFGEACGRVIATAGFAVTIGAFGAVVVEAELRLFDAVLLAGFFVDFFAVFFEAFLAIVFFAVSLTAFLTAFLTVFLVAFLAAFFAFFTTRLLFLARFFATAAVADLRAVFRPFLALAAFLLDVFLAGVATTNSFIV
jgi:hypothetical protein